MNTRFADECAFPRAKDSCGYGSGAYVRVTRMRSDGWTVLPVLPGCAWRSGALVGEVGDVQRRAARGRHHGQPLHAVEDPQPVADRERTMWSRSSLTRPVAR